LSSDSIATVAPDLSSPFEYKIHSNRLGLKQSQCAHGDFGPRFDAVASLVAEGSPIDLTSIGRCGAWKGSKRAKLLLCSFPSLRRRKNASRREPVRHLARPMIGSRPWLVDISGGAMFDFHHLSAALSLLKILVGLYLFAQVPTFFFKLLMGRCSFINGKGGPRLSARAVFPDAQWVETAFEEIKQTGQSENGRAGPSPDADNSRRPIVVEVARGGSIEIHIPEDAFDVAPRAHEAARRRSGYCEAPFR
jgi:hypothetical protein